MGYKAHQDSMSVAYENQDGIETSKAINYLKYAKYLNITLILKMSV